jgi:DNA protecting protein DprA
MPEILAPDDPRIPAHRAQRLGLDPDEDRRQPLWVAGETRALLAPAVGIVGTRRPTAHGLAVARTLAHVSAERGWAVVSGMALGIDEAAHRATLLAGGVTIGVLPSPAPIGLRRGARSLADELLKTGALISDRPVGTPAAAWSFARRNGLLAALCDGVIVVEAPEGSGALLTAMSAEELGVPLAFATAPFGAQNAAGGMAWVAGPAEVSVRAALHAPATLLASVGDLTEWLTVCAMSLRADAAAPRLATTRTNVPGVAQVRGGVRGRVFESVRGAGAAGLAEGDLLVEVEGAGAVLAATLTLLARDGLVEQVAGRWRARGGAVLRSPP